MQEETLFSHYNDSLPAARPQKCAANFFPCYFATIAMSLSKGHSFQVPWKVAELSEQLPQAGVSEKGWMSCWT